LLQVQELKSKGATIDQLTHETVLSNEDYVMTYTPFLSSAAYMEFIEITCAVNLKNAYENKYVLLKSDCNHLAYSFMAVVNGCILLHLGMRKATP
jgi:hypothetical protein